jgi:hypothetical protein
MREHSRNEITRLRVESFSHPNLLNSAGVPQLTRRRTGRLQTLPSGGACSSGLIVRPKGSHPEHRGTDGAKASALQASSSQGSSGSSPKLARGMADVTPRHAPTAAYIAAAVNLAAGLVMLLALRYGIPAGESDLSARIGYVGDHILAWRVGWLVWNVAAISLLGFFVALAALWRERAPILCGLALLCGAAGLAADLGAETILAVVSPGLHEKTYVVVESIAVALTGYLGNGLYAVGGILLTLAGGRELPPRLLWLAAAVWTVALWLSVATLVSSDAGQFASAAALLPLFVLWAGLTGRWLSGRAS